MLGNGLTLDATSENLCVLMDTPITLILILSKSICKSGLRITLNTSHSFSFIIGKETSIEGAGRLR